MERLLWVCLGGALGSGLRYLVGIWAGERFGTTFPYGTLLVNVTGSFLMAFVMHVALSLASFPAGLRLALTTGVLGGLTTYSTFNYETSELLRAGTLGAAALNLGATVVGCLTAGVLGLGVARYLVDS